MSRSKDEQKSTKRRRRPSALITRLGGLPRKTLVMLDVEATDLDGCCDALLATLREKGAAGDDAHAAEIEQLLRHHAEAGADVREHAVAIVHEQLTTPGPPVQALLRFAVPATGLVDDEGNCCRFLWVLLSHEETHGAVDAAVEFADFMDHPEFLEAVSGAETAEALHEAYQRSLDEHVHFRAHIPPELRRTGKLAGGVIADIKRRYPRYGSDLKDGLSSKAFASTVFLYFACIAPAIAFGGLLAVLTKGETGAVEMLVATAICGVAYALLSGQPLTILGSTGPVIIFMGILYPLCQRYGIPYLPTLSWVGLWTMVFLVVLALTDACSWIRYFTRFTDETFAALISLIFIYEAVKDVAAGFSDPAIRHDTALLSLVLAVGTFGIAMFLSHLRQSPYLLRPVREFLSDFGPTIAIMIMSAVSFLLHEVQIETLKVPLQIATSSGRPWFVNPFDAPKWVWAAAAVPALLVSILLFLDQNITVRLVNSKEHALKKGVGYHLDLLVVALLVGVCSLFGLPWMVAATVRSLNHVRSLATIETAGGHERITAVAEQRLTGLGVHLLIGTTLLFLGLLRQVPLSVLFGLFLFMGIASMTGNQLFERLRLWIMDPARYPLTYYLRAVPRGKVHKFTLVQVGCLIVLWVVKASVLGIAFPLFVALLVPMRMGLDRVFKAEHLALLDAEETPKDEQERAPLL